MAIIYNGEHKLHFIDGTYVYDSWKNLHLIPESSYIMNPFQPSLALTNKTASNSSIDLTESIGGSIGYSMPSTDISFITDTDLWSDYEEEILDVSDIREMLTGMFNGKVMKVLFLDYPREIYTERVYLKKCESTDAYPQVTVCLEYINSKKLTGIDVSYDQNAPSVIAGASLSSFKPYIHIDAIYGDYTTYVDELMYSLDYSLSGDISTSGSKTITVKFGGKTDTFTVNVIAKSVTSISAIYDSSYNVYTGSTIDSLKNQLIVVAFYNDNSQSFIEPSDYSLSGNISSIGTKTITVTYSGITTTFSVNVIGVSSITALYDLSHNVRVGDSLDSLKTYLTVTAIYGDGSSIIVPASNYTLIGDLSTKGTKTITVIYSSKSKTFRVNVVAVTITSISATYDFSHTVYTSDSLDSLKSYLTVKANYDDGTQSTISSSDYSLSGDISTSGTKTITVIYSDKTTTFTVNVVAVTITSISATYDSSHTVYTSDSLNLLKSYLTVKANYDNGTQSTISSSNYSLSGDISTSGTKTITVTYSDKTTTFTVNVIDSSGTVTQIIVTTPGHYDSDYITLNVGDNLDTIKQYLVVYVFYDNDSSSIITDNEYILAPRSSADMTTTGRKLIDCIYALDNSISTFFLIELV